MVSHRFSYDVTKQGLRKNCIPFSLNCNKELKSLSTQFDNEGLIMTEEKERERRRRNFTLGAVLVIAVIIMYAGIFFKMS